MKNLLTIKEFSKLSGIKISNLRYYDEIDLLKPDYRGENNYRLYNINQLYEAWMIDTFKGMNVTLREIKNLKKSRDPQIILNLLRSKLNYLHDEKNKISQLEEIFKKWMDDIENAYKITAPKIVVKQLEERFVQVGSEIFEIENIDEPIVNFIREHRKRKNVVFFDSIGLLFPQTVIQDRTWRGPLVFYSKDVTGNHKIEAGQYLVSYDNYGNTVEGLHFERVYEYLNENNFLIYGNVYAECDLNEISILEPEDFLIKVFFRVEPKYSI